MRADVTKIETEQFVAQSKREAKNKRRGVAPVHVDPPDLRGKKVFVADGCASTVVDRQIRLVGLSSVGDRVSADFCLVADVASPCLLIHICLALRGGSCFNKAYLAQAAGRSGACTGGSLLTYPGVLHLRRRLFISPAFVGQNPDCAELLVALLEPRRGVAWKCVDKPTVKATGVTPKHRHLAVAFLTRKEQESPQWQGVDTRLRLHDIPIFFGQIDRTKSIISA